MEKLPECHAEECTNVATYLHKGFNVNICDEHYQLNHKESCVKLENIGEPDGIKEALEVIQTCIKNFRVVLDSDNDKETQEETIRFLAEIQTQIQEIFKEIEKGDGGQEFLDIHDINNKVRDIFLKLRSEEGFKQFCVINYIHLMGDYLGINKSKTNRIIGITGIKSEMEIDLRLLDNKNTKSYKELEKELVELKQRAISLIDPSTLQGLEKYYKLVTNKSQNIASTKKLILEFDNEKDIEFVKNFGGNIVPNLENLEIDKILENLEVAKEFLFSSFPQSVENFHLNFKGRMHNCDEIIDVLCYLNPRIMRSLHIYRFELSQIQMKKIFQITKQIQTYIGFRCCKLELDTIPDFGNSLDGLIIRILSFNYCGKPEYSDWKNHLERFTNLVKGLSKSSHFKQKIKGIELLDCGMTKIHVRQILNLTGFQNLQINSHSI
ncbi:unnamed protein product [Moneuplotes crassus]|uniref:Uncharacterized protein n=1 Tax=Euplotes crassus TaxID=5936 RepID=A0AAD1UMT1_EUPCR|nr:unnamed protein product [Moneuplotes crassus]